MTYRMGDHSTSDNSALYRKDDEIYMEQACPIYAETFTFDDIKDLTDLSEEQISDLPIQIAWSL